MIHARSGSMTKNTKNDKQAIMDKHRILFEIHARPFVDAFWNIDLRIVPSGVVLEPAIADCNAALSFIVIAP